MPPMRKDCVPDAEIPVQYPKRRKYSGPPKGSQEAKDRMAKVRAAQWAKNGLSVSGQGSRDGGDVGEHGAPTQRN